MRATNETPVATAENIIPLKIERAPKRRIKTRFNVKTFTNNAGSTSWRVEGIMRDGTRVRLNYRDESAAKCKQLELEKEYLGDNAVAFVANVKSTRLSEDQIRLAEAAFIRLGNDAELPLAIDYWIQHGRQRAVAESPKLDEAVTKFKEWLDKDAKAMKKRTKQNLCNRITVFARYAPNLRIADFTKRHVLDYLAARNITPGSRDNDRRAVGRFFTWCMYEERKWTTFNPAQLRKNERKDIPALATGRKPKPAILTLDQCQAMLKAAEKQRKGRLVPFVAVSLFAGLRPSEAQRLTWDKVNLKDLEIAIDDSKNNRDRIIEIEPTLAKWLKAYEGKPFYPKNWRKDFAAIKKAGGFYSREAIKKEGEKKWIPDIMRHSAISFFLREHDNAYGKAAAYFDNSEPIIKKHYEARVSSDDAEKFYALRPRP
jgi:integrase